ncbi:MAG TPA: hypothetical protein VLA66_10675, partial [Thermoanaerobaculia bacterium]|nr:hypothetical protein [Thermoanaerobaculia bacterium]
GARALAVYLPALDLLAADWTGGSEPFAELVRIELVAADRLVESLAGFGTVVVVVDPGRRGGEQGRILLGRPGCASETRPALEPAAVASALLRALGLPQSEELPAPPAICPWPEPPARVPSFGERAPGPGGAERAGEYLENLRSLGYL